MESEDEDAFIPLPATQASAETQESRGAPGLITAGTAKWRKYGQQHDIGANVSPFVRLHNEILEFCDYVKLDEEELLARKTVVDDVQRIALGLWPEATVHVFGSEFTGVLLPTSDLDFVVMNCPADAHSALYAMQEAIETEQLASYIEVIANAKVPIVKMDHASTGIAVDICCDVTNGLNTGRIIRAYMEEFPQLMPLTLVLKMFLSQRKLNETYLGGVGSFLLVLMIVSFLQMQRKLANSKVGAVTTNLGALLLEFLDLYGKTFNYYTTAISVRGGGSYFPKRQRFDWCVPNRPWALSVENPDQTELDVGKNSFEIRKVKRAFETAHTALSAALRYTDEESFLAYLIRPNDVSLDDRPIRRWDRFAMKKLVACRSADTYPQQSSDDEGHYSVDHRSDSSHAPSNLSQKSKSKKRQQHSAKVAQQLGEVDKAIKTSKRRVKTKH